VAIPESGRVPPVSAWRSRHFWSGEDGNAAIHVGFIAAVGESPDDLFKTFGVDGAFIALSAFRKNIVDNAGDRRIGVNAHSILRNILFRRMQSRNQFLFACSSAILVFWSPGKQIGKAGEIPGAAAEEGDRVALISDQGFDFVYIPNVVLVPKAIRRFTCLWIASIDNSRSPLQTEVLPVPETPSIK
jgi:hypothetical protein